MRHAAAILGVMCAGCGSTTIGQPVDSGTNGVDRPVPVDIPAIVDAGAMDSAMALRDVEDVPTAIDVAVIDVGPSCSMLPNAPVPTVDEGFFEPGATAFALNAAGDVVVAGLDGIVVRITSDGDTRTVTTIPMGFVIGLAFSQRGEIVLEVVNSLDGGVPATGQILAINISTLARRVVVATAEGPKALAVDAYNYLWFTDSVAGTISRVSLDAASPFAVVVSSDVPGPNGLAFDAAGANLYVTSYMPGAASSIFQIPLTWGDGGVSVMALPATPYVGGTTRANSALQGIGLDQCGNVYAVDQTRNQIWRIPPPPETEFLQIVTDVTSPFGFAFGQGGAFSNQSIYTIDSSGTLRTAPVGVPGVPLPIH